MVSKLQKAGKQDGALQDSILADRKTRLLSSFREPPTTCSTVGLLSRATNHMLDHVEDDKDLLTLRSTLVSPSCYTMQQQRILLMQFLSLLACLLTRDFCCKQNTSEDIPNSELRKHDHFMTQSQFKTHELVCVQFRSPRDTQATISIQPDDVADASAPQTPSSAAKALSVIASCIQSLFPLLFATQLRKTKLGS